MLCWIRGRCITHLPFKASWLARRSSARWIRRSVPLLQRVEPHRAAGHHLVPRLGGKRPKPVADHLRRSREEAVLMRIIGGPHDLVRAEIVCQYGNPAFGALGRG